MSYQFRLAWLSLRRNPVLSVLMVCGIGLGIAVSMTFIAAYANVSGDPIPHKSDKLYYVSVDFWNPDDAYNDDDPTLPPDQLTYRDALALQASDIPTYKSAMYKSYLTVHPEGHGERPFREETRMCYRDFFPMFDVAFRFGGPWSAEADAGPEQVVVLGYEVNQRLFGGENSVGRKLRIEEAEFEIAGVLEPWKPLPKYYDTHNQTYGSAEEIFMPFGLGKALEIRTAGNTSSWSSRGATYQDLLDSEAIWIQFWAQLDDERQKDEYLAYIDGYVREQTAMGRPGRAGNTRLRDVMAWLHYAEVVPDEAQAMLINAVLFLLVCSVNLIGILLGKFLARSPEVGLRRALGASRRWVFAQHLLECELIGVMGCALGLVATVGGLNLLERMFGGIFEFALNPQLLVVALVLALLSALIAGLYPAWRICRIQPGVQLKTQ